MADHTPQTKRWTFTRSRHRNALVFALSGIRFPSLGFNVTLGLGLWSFHAAYRKEVPR